MFTLIDEDLIAPFDDYLTSDEDKKWISGFYPAFMENSQTGGKTYGIPFQRSTPVLYWNKEAFKEAGLDPETAPATWKKWSSSARNSPRPTLLATSPSGACVFRLPVSPTGCSRVWRSKTA